jgi:hypothetical protein
MLGGYMAGYSRECFAFQNNAGGAYNAKKSFEAGF